MKHHSPDDTPDPLLEPLSQLVHQAPVGLAETADDGTVLLLNPTAARLLVPFVERRRLDNLFDALGPQGEALRTLCRAAEGRPGRLVHGYRVGRPAGVGEGGPTTLGINITRADPDRLIVSLEDLSELTGAERAARQAQARADAASLAKSRFLAGTSHELRQPLNAILGFAEVMQHQMLGPMETHYRDYAGHIAAAGGHLLAVINDLLDLSKVEAGEMTLESAPIPLGEVFDHGRRMFAGRAEARRITLEADDGGLWALADRRRLDQILINLLSNALKFTPEGGRVDMAAAPEGPARVRLTVSDSGPGIAPRDLARVMQPYGQTAEGRRRDDSTGLGLPLARALAEAMGGTLDLASRLGAGTTAILILPAAKCSSNR